MSNWAKECKELKTGLIGLAVTKSIPKKTRQRITRCGDAAVKFIVDPLGETKKYVDGPNKESNPRTIHIHIHKK